MRAARLMAATVLACAVVAAVAALVGYPILAIGAAVYGAVWGVVTFVTCRSVRRHQRTLRTRQKENQRLLRDLRGSNAVRVFSPASVEELNRLWAEENVTRIPALTLVDGEAS